MLKYTLFSGLGPNAASSFSHLKIWLCGKKFLSNEVVIVTVNAYFSL